MAAIDNTVQCYQNWNFNQEITDFDDLASLQGVISHTRSHSGEITVRLWSRSQKSSNLWLNTPINSQYPIMQLNPSSPCILPRNALSHSSLCLSQLFLSLMTSPVTHTSLYPSRLCVLGWLIYAPLFWVWSVRFFENYCIYLLCFIAGGSGLGAAGTIAMLLLQQQIQMQLLGVKDAEIFQKMLLVKDRTWNGLVRLICKI
jgi:hypothetical protein